MTQTVNLALLQGWIDKNGIAELERLSGVSIHTILRIKNRRNPSVPKTAKTRIRLADAIGVPEAELFPLAATRGGSRKRATAREVKAS